MPERVRLFYKMVGPYHVFTSPDVKGLHAAMETLPAARREAIAVLDKMAELEGVQPPDFIFHDDEKQAA